jgi:hypothetical protein
MAADASSAMANSMAREPDSGHRALQTATCSLCGIELPIGLMVPDGGQACTDLRWYCKDARSCTERWTAHPPRLARRLAPAAEAEAEEAEDTSEAAVGPEAVRSASAGPGPDERPAAQLGGPAEPA